MPTNVHYDNSTTSAQWCTVCTVHNLLILLLLLCSGRDTRSIPQCLTALIHAASPGPISPIYFFPVYFPVQAKDDLWKPPSPFHSASRPHAVHATSLFARLAGELATDVSSFDLPRLRKAMPVSVQSGGGLPKINSHARPQGLYEVRVHYLTIRGRDVSEMRSVRPRCPVIPRK